MSRNRFASSLRSLKTSNRRSKNSQRSTREKNFNYDALEARQLLAVDTAINFTTDFGFGGVVAANSVGVGPQHVVTVHNGQLRIYSKANPSGVPVVSKSLANFWLDNGSGNAVGANSATEMVGNISDPSVVYDVDTRRWFMTAVSSADVLTSNDFAQNPILLAVSRSSDPTQNWQSVTSNRFDHDSDPLTGDITRVGGFVPGSPTGRLAANMSIDDFNVYVTVDYTDPMATDQVWVFNKFSDLVVPNPRVPAAVPIIDVTDPLLEWGMDVAGTTQGTFGVSTNTDGTKIRLFELKDSNDPTKIALAPPLDLPVTMFEKPPISVRQLFDPDIINSGTELTASVVRHGDSLWAAHAIKGSAGTSAIRWYEIDLIGKTIKQSGTIENPVINYIYPSIAVTAKGHVAIGYTSTGFSAISSEGQFPSVSVSIGYSINNVTAFEAPVVIKNGLGGYFDAVGNFWSESSIAIDPNSPDKIWVMAPWSNATGAGRIQLAELTLLGHDPKLLGTPGDDLIVIRRSATDATQIEVLFNGVVTATYQESSMYSITVDGGGGIDTFVLDTVNGELDLPDGVKFVGDGDDIVRVDSDLNTDWDIDGDGSGLLSQSTTSIVFSGMKAIDGSRAVDTFNVLNTNTAMMIRGRAGDDAFIIENVGTGEITGNGNEGKDSFTIKNSGGGVMLNGDEGDDQFTFDDVGTGLATLSGGADNDLFSIVNSGMAGLMINGEAGDDTFDIDNELGTAETVIRGGFGDDRFNVINSGLGTLSLLGDEGDDTYRITFVAPTIDFSIEDSSNSESDSLFVLGTVGNDSFTINGDQALIGGGDWLVIGVENYTIDGLEGNDIFDINLGTAFIGSVTLNGGLGNDKLTVNNAGMGSFHLNGGDGNDLYTIQFGGMSSIQISDTGGIDSLIGLGTPNADVLSLAVDSATVNGVLVAIADIESVEYYGFEGDDIFNIASAIGNSFFSGGAGNDTFNVGSTADGNRYQGDAGDDVFNIASTSGMAVFSGGAGNDTFNVMSTTGKGTFLGEAGDDLFNIGSSTGTSTYRGGSGIDKFVVTNRLPKGSVGLIDIDGGTGRSQLIVNGYETLGNFVTITNDRITGMSAVPISYRSTGGNFTVANAGGGVTLIGSNTIGDTFTVNSFRNPNSLLLMGRGGDDVFTVYESALGTVQADGQEGSDLYQIAAGTQNNRNVQVLDSGVVGNDTVVMTLNDSDNELLMAGQVFNVSTDRILINNNIESMFVNTRGGNDRVFVGRIKVGYLRILLGDGNDRIDVIDLSTIKNGLSVDGGNGRDTFSFTNTIAGSMAQAFGGDGEDTFVASGSALGNLYLDGQDASDNFIVTLAVNSNRVIQINDTGNTIADRLEINGTQGKDTISMRLNTITSGRQIFYYTKAIDTVTVQTGDGDDNISVYGLSSERTNILTGNGRDQFYLYSSFGFGSQRFLNVDLGAGDDAALVRSLNADSQATISGGSGNDVFNIGSSAAENNGALQRIAGQLSLVGGDGSDFIYLNDFGAERTKNYVVSGTLITQSAATGTPLSGRISYSSAENLRLIGTNFANKLTVTGSPKTAYRFIGNGGGNQILLDPVDAGIDGRQLTKTSATSGFWKFTNGKRDIFFEDFNVI